VPATARAAKYPGLAAPDTRERAKAMAADLVAGGGGEPSASAPPPPPPPPAARDRSCSRSRSRDRGRRRRSRSRSRDRRHRSRSRGRRRSRSRSPRGGGGDRRGGLPPPPPPSGPATPTVGAIYRGTVTGVVDFGAFVRLAGVGPPPAEGLVHASALPPVPGGAPRSARDAVARGDNVWVQVLSIGGGKVALSMAAVDQATGRAAAAAAPTPAHNPAAPSAPSSSTRTSLHGLSGVAAPPPRPSGRRPGGRARLSSPERWELTQLVKAGVLDPADLPDYDEDEGGLVAGEAGVEEEFEVDLNDDEPAFLAGVSSRSAAADVSPIKIVKNPDGTMQRAAMTQQALAKVGRGRGGEGRRARARLGAPHPPTLPVTSSLHRNGASCASSSSATPRPPSRATCRAPGKTRCPKPASATSPPSCAASAWGWPPRPSGS